MSENEPIEGKVVDTGPICHTHGETPSMHGFRQNWPAHTWTTASGGKCQRCPEPVVKGDLYVCHENGIAHVTCRRPALPPPADEADAEYDEQLSLMAQDANSTCPTPPGGQS